MPVRSTRVTAMPAVHEQVDDGAEQEQHIRQRTKKVRSMLLPEEEGSDRQEKARAQPHGDSKRLVLRVSFSCGLHDDLLIELHVDYAAFLADTVS